MALTLWSRTEPWLARSGRGEAIINAWFGSKWCLKHLLSVGGDTQSCRFQRHVRWARLDLVESNQTYGVMYTNQS